MDTDIHLIIDGDGLAVIGDSVAVERFLAEEGLPSTDLGLPRLRNIMSTGAASAQAGSAIAAKSGRWVKLTSESAQRVKDLGLRESSRSGLSTGVLRGDKGQIAGFVEFARPGALLTNPAFLAGAAGIMAQVAMQQTMNEITDYLATIDAKVEDVLRGQKDAVLADMIGVGFVIEEAMTIREHVRRVSEVTWSKVSGTSMTIAQTQAYALRQLDAIAVKLECASKVGDLAKVTREAESQVPEWLAVLARCFQLHDAIAVLELDRVLDAAPEELDQHRLGVRAARRDRCKLITDSTGELLARMDTAAGTAQQKVLLHPGTSRAVVDSRNHVAGAVVDLHARLGLEGVQQSLEARRWTEAATEVRDRVVATGAGGVQDARRRGAETVGRARALTGRLSGEIAERGLRRWGSSSDRSDLDTDGAETDR